MSDESQKLNENSLGLWESIIMGVAGTAPAFSLAATTGLLITGVGMASLASLVYCGLIMFGVSLAFLYLNRMHANAGACFIWVSEIFNPVLGFLAGWSLLVASVVFMVSGTVPAAIATLALLNPAKVDDPVSVALVASGWLVLVGAILIKGIKLSSYFQVVLTVIEIVLLMIIITGALFYFSSNPVQPFEWKQLSPVHFTFGTFALGALTSLFFFWGWDVTVNLSEETKKANDNPGIGAVGAMIIVMAIFVSFMLAIQFALTPQEIEKAGPNLIFVLANKVFPSPWSYMAIIAVMLSTVGTLETTILQFTRTMFAKGRYGILNPRYACLHRKWKTPWVSTLVIVGIGLVLLFVSAFFHSVNDIIEVSVKAIGFQIAFYYGLTCYACAWRLRHKKLKHVRDFIFWLWSLLSGFFMTFIFIYCAITFEWTTTALGIGGILLGFIPLLMNKLRR